MKFYKNEAGQLHREDGPAIEWPNGIKYYYLNGKLHRTDGPAIEWSDGTKDYYLNGKEVTEAHVSKIGRLLFA